MTTTSTSHAPRMKRLLLICSLPPYPARASGFSVRYAPILDALERDYEIHVAIVADVPIERSEIEEVRRRVKRVELLERQRRKLSMGQRLLARTLSLTPIVLPYPVFAHDMKEIEAFIAAFAGDTDYDALVLASPRYAGICARRVKARRRVLDAIDSVSLLFQRSAGARMLDRFDLARIRSWERSLASKFDAMSYISTTDVHAVFGSRDVPTNVAILPNGVFAADDAEPDPAVRDPHRVEFLGNMGYPPNVSAAHRLVRLMREVRKEVPGARVSFIGRGSEDVLREYVGAEGVDVRGTVPSIWPELRGAALCCFPMTEGAGQQNKVIEAMWAGCAVVTTSIGNSGVGATHDKHLFLADSDQEVVAGVIELLRSPDRAAALGKGGREFVEQRYDSRRCVEEARRVLVDGGFPATETPRG